MASTISLREPDGKCGLVNGSSIIVVTCNTHTHTVDADSPLFRRKDITASLSYVNNLT